MDLTRYPFKPVNRASATGIRSTFPKPNVRFCDAVDHLVSKQQLPSEFQNDYVSFLRLAVQVLSGKTAIKKCRAAFERFISVIHTVPEDARKSMSEALVLFRADPAISSLITDLRRSLDEIELNQEEKVKLERVRDLERWTAVPRTRGDARCSGEQFSDRPDLKKFMESDEVATRLYGFYGIADARNELEALVPKLPKGCLYEALGKGKTAYIVIEKPCWRQRQDWIDYCANKKALEKAREELKIVQGDMRRFGFKSTVSTTNLG